MKRNIFQRLRYIGARLTKRRITPQDIPGLIGHYVPEDANFLTGEWVDRSGCGNHLKIGTPPDNVDGLVFRDDA